MPEALVQANAPFRRFELALLATVVLVVGKQVMFSARLHKTWSQNYPMHLKIDLARNATGEKNTKPDHLWHQQRY